MIEKVLNMPIELKCNNYYSKVFKRVNYKLQNNIFFSSNQRQLHQPENEFRNSQSQMRKFRISQIEMRKFRINQIQMRKFRNSFPLAKFLQLHI